jgi:predicted Zn-dependent protease
MLQQAAAHLQAGRFAQGAVLCRQVLELVPGQPDGLHLLAMAAAAQGDVAEAEKLFLESLARVPRRPDILVNFGKFLRGQGRLPEGQKRLRRAVKLAPDFVPGWYNLGLLLHGGSQLKEAARCAHKVTRLAPDYAAGWELLAAVEQKRGNPVAAIDACRQGLRHQPTASRLHYSLAQLLRQECEFTEAARSYSAARTHGHETPELYRNEAEALLEAGDIEQAMACATAGVQRFPEHAVLQRTRARLHWESGIPGDPVAVLWQAARDRPANADLWCTLAQLLERLQREDESHAALLEARQLGCPGTPEIRMLDAMACARAGQPGEATDRFSELVKAFPDHSDIKLSFAGHLMTQGSPAQAESLCAGVLETDPVNQLAWAYRGTAWQLLGDPREAWLLDYQRMVRPVPVPVPQGYGSREAFFHDVQVALESLHRTQAHPIEQSLRGGTQTNGFLFRLKHPLLSVLEAQIRQAISTALEEFPDDNAHPFWGRRIPRPGGDGVRFAGAWSVRLRSEGFHTNHIHTEGWISSALYIALPDEVRQDPGPSGHIQFGVPMVELGLTLPPQRTVRPEVGTLVLFPSYMWHGTVPFTSQQPRITVAFDLLPQN